MTSNYAGVGAPGDKVRVVVDVGDDGEELRWGKGDDAFFAVATRVAVFYAGGARLRGG